MAGMDVTAFTLAYVVLYVLLLVAFSMGQTIHHGVSIDVPRTAHPRSMWRAQRKDALVVGIVRTGDIFFASDKIAPDQLSQKIGERIRADGGERKVYIRADGRAKWGTIAEVIDQVRAAGIPEVGFLADQRKSRP